MRINEILQENIFTCDYRRVMDAVAHLYKEHYDVDIWSNAAAHDEAAQVLMKEHPNNDELDYIIDTSELPERFMQLSFPLNDEVMYGVNGGIEEDSDVDEAASRKLCQSSKSDRALGASNLSSCKSQGFRARDGAKTHKIGSTRIAVRGKKIKGKKYGGELPDWS
jgi:hypothetical protein